MSSGAVGSTLDAEDATLRFTEASLTLGHLVCHCSYLPPIGMYRRWGAQQGVPAAHAAHRLRPAGLLRDRCLRAHGHLLAPRIAGRVHILFEYVTPRNGEWNQHNTHEAIDEYCLSVRS